MKFEEALQTLRKEEKRKFVQTVDLIVNLQNIDVKKEPINTFITLPHPSEKKICAFLTKKSKVTDTITKEEFDRYKDEASIKRLADGYDFFIAVASLMPAIATKFGRVLGPAGKMPTPQAGIMPVDNEEAVLAMSNTMKQLIRVRGKESSLKIPIGKEDMTDKDIIENVFAALAHLERVLPKKKENIKNVMIKFTMTKTMRVEL